MKLLYKAITLDVKASDEKGSFTGYISRFGEKDAGGDIVMPGAFANSLKEWADSGRSVPILWQHRTGEPIGAWKSLTEDDTGLLGAGQLWLDEAPYARVAHKGMQTKAITGLSIGYGIKRAARDSKTQAQLLHELTLAEASVVTNPMLHSARVDAVKSLIFENGLPTIREFEDYLRDAGFSKQQAVIIASHGLPEMLKRRDSAGEDQKAAVQVLDLLSTFKL